MPLTMKPIIREQITTAQIETLVEKLRLALSKYQGKLVAADVERILKDEQLDEDLFGVVERHVEHKRFGTTERVTKQNAHKSWCPVRLATHRCNRSVKCLCVTAQYHRPFHSHEKKGNK